MTITNTLFHPHATFVANKILDFYSDCPDRWTQGTYARDKEGKAIWYSADEATSFCTLGTLLKLQNDGEITDKQRLAFAQRFKKVNKDSVTKFNDDHTFPEVLNALMKLT